MAGGFHRISCATVAAGLLLASDQVAGQGEGRAEILPFKGFNNQEAKMSINYINRAHNTSSDIFEMEDQRLVVPQEGDNGRTLAAIERDDRHRLRSHIL